jgi:hypothetical protein
VAIAGTGMPSANRPNEDLPGVNVVVSDGPPDGGQDLGGADTGDLARVEETQTARERASPELGETRRVALLRQVEEAAARK